jgi:fructoselysine-6-P-deglycase FrlB-like protein
MTTDRAPAIHEEIASQPDCWERLLAAGAELAERLPAHGSRVLAVGCGTSLHVTRSFAQLRETRGLGETDYAPASQLPRNRSYDALVVVSRSGTTTEIIRALELLSRGTPTFGILADGSSPVAELVDVPIVLPFADEQSVVQTRFPTTALNLLRLALGENLVPVIADGRQALEAQLPRPGGDLTHAVFLGDRWTVGLADEAALKFRETAGRWSESYPAMEFRHGPISASTANTLVWSFDPLPHGLHEVLAEEVGAQVEVAELDPVAELVRVQRQAVLTAETDGRDPDSPPFLDRAVILP